MPFPLQAKDVRNQAEQLGFQPHKALYNIKLAAAKSGSQILNITGQMYYEWQPVCDAWITNHRFNILYEYADSAPMRVTSNFSTFETFDGTSFNFTSQRKRDGQVFEEIRGNAELAEDGAGKALFTMPGDVDFDLPKGTLFPIAHSLDVAQKVRSGKTFFNLPIFDGSDEEGPVSVNVFVGKDVVPEQSNFQHAALNQDLLKSPAKSLRLAFFPVYNEEETADYEMTLVFHENSLISDMLIEYDDFSVSQTLVAAEPVENGCNPDADLQPSPDTPREN